MIGLRSALALIADLDLIHEGRSLVVDKLVLLHRLVASCQVIVNPVVLFVAPSQRLLVISHSIIKSVSHIWDPQIWVLLQLWDPIVLCCHVGWQLVLPIQPGISYSISLVDPELSQNQYAIDLPEEEDATHCHWNFEPWCLAKHAYLAAAVTFFIAIFFKIREPCQDYLCGPYCIIECVDQSRDDEVPSTLDNTVFLENSHEDQKVEHI